MLRVILGVVALGATGYGVSKLLVDDDFRDNVKEKIQDGAFKAYDGVEKLEEMMGLNEFELEAIPTNDTKKENTSDDFTKLYHLKLSIYNQMKEDKSFTLKENKIRADNTIDIEITDKMQTSLASYVYILETVFSRYKNIQNKNDEDAIKYSSILQDICKTQIIKKGELNHKSSKIILKAMRALLGEQEPIHVKLDV